MQLQNMHARFQLNPCSSFREEDLEAPRSLNRSPGYQSITVCHDMHCLRKNAARNKTLIVPLCSSNQITPWYQFSLKSDKVNIFHISAILKKYGWLEIKFDSTIMFAASNYPKISIFIEIGQSLHFCDMAAILKKNGGSKIKFDCTIMFTISKTTYSNLNYLSSYYTFWDIKCQSGKIRKKRH